MLDSATTKVVFGGLAHADDLNRIGRLAGDIDVPYETRSWGAGGASRSASTQRLAVLPLEKIRCLPAGHALVLARRCAPVEVVLQPYWKHHAHRSSDKASMRDTSADPRSANSDEHPADATDGPHAQSHLPVGGAISADDDINDINEIDDTDGVADPEEGSC
jgi:hypothetical protein